MPETHIPAIYIILLKINFLKIQLRSQQRDEETVCRKTFYSIFKQSSTRGDTLFIGPLTFTILDGTAFWAA